MQGNATFLEVLFTTIGAVGLVFVITGFPDIIGDLVFAMSRRKRARPTRIVALEVKYITAISNLRREVGRLVTLAMCTGLGAFLSTRPQSGPNNLPSIAGIIVGYIILAMEFDITFQSIMDRVDRARLQTAILGPRRTLDEAIQAEVQQRRRASDPPPTTPSE